MKNTINDKLKKNSQPQEPINNTIETKKTKDNVHELVQQEQINKQLQECNKKILLLQAENENLRKRFEKQIKETADFAITEFAYSIVETLDNLYRARTIINTKNSSISNYQALSKGIELTQSSLEKNLTKHGIQRLFPKGEKYDYRFHEALSQIVDNKISEGTITEVIQAGYTIKSRVLKSAKVIVSTKQTPS